MSAPANRWLGWLNDRRRAVAAALSGVLVLVLTLAVAGAIRQPSRDRLLEEGVQAYHAGEVGRAIDSFNRALDAGADRKRTLFLRARVHQRSGNWEAALTDYKEADPDGNDGRILACLGYCYSKNKEFDLAAHSFDKAIAKGFAKAEVLNDLGYVLLERIIGRKPEAEKLFKEAIKQSPALPAPYRNLVRYERGRAGARPGEVSQNEINYVTDALIHCRPDGGLYLEAAQVFALLVLRSNNPSLEDHLVGILNQAIDHGIDPKTIGKDVLFKKWQGDPRFLELLSRQAGSAPSTPTECFLDPVQELGE